MPVTITPSTHGANIITKRFAENAQEALKDACPGVQWRCLELLQSSFDEHQIQENVIPNGNGFVNSLVEAYSSHQHLTLRPEDIWFAILTQFSNYVNAHAEELRQHFVAHEGKKKLSINYGGTRYGVDFADFAKNMAGLIDENVVDPELQKWIMPGFSTSTDHDDVVASILMMGTMQKYFEYECCVDCGIPSVTLLGEKADYERILVKLEKLNSFGEEPSWFCELLRPVIRRFIMCFDDPDDEEVIDFWQRVFDINNQMSGLTEYSGWITAFCFWNDDGRCLYHRQTLFDDGCDYHQEKFGDIEEDSGRGYLVLSHTSLNLELDGVRYHKIDADDVPYGWCKVPVTINDNGQVIQTDMIAGSVGMACSSSEKPCADGKIGLDSVQPATGWWIFEKMKDS